MSNKIIVVLGPTAVGKTALGIDLANRYQGEIISGDSQQVYRKLDIGTAKATPEEQAQAKHYLIDVRDPDQAYSAFDFVQEAKAAIETIRSHGKVPIIVGGTGLYLQSLMEGYHLGGQVDHDEILAYRATLENLDKAALMARLDEANIPYEAEDSRRRLMRKLEIAHFDQDLSNETVTDEFLVIGLNTDRQLLYDRINQRVDLMMEAGLLEEAKWLYEHYPEAQASRGIGYKELFPYFAGEQTLEEAVEKLKQNTRRFAKRQLTWFRNRMQVTFYDLLQDDQALARIHEACDAFLAE